MRQAPPPSLRTHVERITAYARGTRLSNPQLDDPGRRQAVAEFIRTHAREVLDRWVGEIGTTFGISPDQWASIKDDQHDALLRWARHIAAPDDLTTYDYLAQHTRRGFIAQFPASRFLAAQMRLTDLLAERLRDTEGHDAADLCALLQQEFRVRILHITDFFVEGREEMLLEQETSYRRWLDHAPACILRADAADGRVFDVNLVAERVLGYDRRELVGKLLHELHPPTEAGTIRDLLDGVRTGRHETRDGVHLKRRTEPPLPVYISAGPIDYGDRHWVQLVYVDVSERKRLESQLIQSEKMAAIGQLAAGIAHELRNPLAIVMNALYDLRQHLGDADATVCEDVGICEEEIGRTQAIIRNLLEFSRESGVEIESVDVNELLERTVQLLRKYLETSRVRVVTELGEIPPCAANANAMRQILLNLVTNAVQAMPTGGELRLRTERPSNDRIRLHVIDTGVGIPPDRLTRIFDPFYTTKAPGQGTGLGLSVVHSVVQRYGGEISVTSRLDHGTTFIIELPCPCHQSVGILRSATE